MGSPVFLHTVNGSRWWFGVFLLRNERLALQGLPCSRKHLLLALFRVEGLGAKL